MSNYFLRLNEDSGNIKFNNKVYSPPWTIELLIKKTKKSDFSHLITGADKVSGIRFDQHKGNNKIGITHKWKFDYTFNFEFPIGIWTNLILIGDLDNTYLYINYELIDFVNIPFDLPFFLLGADRYSYGQLNADIRSLRIWGKSFTETEIIKNIHNEEFASLKNNYRFTPNPDKLLVDTIGNNNGIIWNSEFIKLNKFNLQIDKLNYTPNNKNIDEKRGIILRLKNEGFNEITKDFNVILNHGSIKRKKIIRSSIKPFKFTDTKQLIFKNIKLDNTSNEIINLNIEFPKSKAINIYNKALQLSTNSFQLGDLTDFTISQNNFIVSSKNISLRIRFYSDKIFNISNKLADINYSQITDFNEKNEKCFKSIKCTIKKKFIVLETAKVILKINKYPILFKLIRKDNKKIVWSEKSPLFFASSSVQKIKRSINEEFVGCGMQCNKLFLRNKTVEIGHKKNNWTEVETPNSVPFFMSSNGYGIFRNTFKKGKYKFSSTVTIEHEDNEFDCFYIFGPSVKEIIKGYTEIVGKSFLPAKWMLNFGDAGCYNEEFDKNTKSLHSVIKEYKRNKFELKWIIPNDGYQCGCNNYIDKVALLKKEKIKFGLWFDHTLWNEDGIKEMEYAIRYHDVRILKIDIAASHFNNQYAFNMCKMLVNLIEKNCDERGMVLSINGWAGTHKYSVIWSGDHTSSWGFIKKHIPAIQGASLSGFNCSTSDVGAIFGENPVIFTRDLQWKCFIPILSIISGWSYSKFKHPWISGKPFTEINRKFLIIRSKLLSYLYSYCMESNFTGIPTVRSLLLEFPEDSNTLSSLCQYQFMSGEWLLIAPIFDNSDVKKEIYLPEGKWIDFWTLKEYQGSNYLKGYICPLNRLPVFIRSGAIIPNSGSLWKENIKSNKNIIFSIFPSSKSKTIFYEDDGVSHNYLKGYYNKTFINIDYSNNIDSCLTISIVKEHDWKAKRRMDFELFLDFVPQEITINEKIIDKYDPVNSCSKKFSGWNITKFRNKNIVYIKIYSTRNFFKISIK